MISENVPVESANPRPLRVLVADDHPANQAVMTGMLQRLGHEVVVVSDGLAAMNAFERGSWDALFIDCRMPVMDGYETTRAIRAIEHDGNRRPLHIVAVTAADSAEEREQCRQAGMNGYLAKPVRMTELRRQLEECGVAEPGAPRRHTGEIVIDRPVWDELRAISGDGFAEMIGNFVNTCAELVRDFRSALARGDSESAKAVLHALKGTARNFGAAGLGDEAERIERQWNVSGFTRTVEAGASIEAAFDRARAAIGAEIRAHEKR